MIEALAGLPWERLILAGLLLVAAATDLTRRLIPNRLILVGLSCFLLLTAADFWGAASEGAGLERLGGRLAAGGMAFLIHWLPYRFQGMGAGDVKLALLTGLLPGWRPWLDYLGCYCLVLLAVALVFLGLGKKRPQTFPLAPLMAAAYVLLNILPP
ncbi:MAG: prepilin peptidase [Peptococcaceae bacterium]|jgi:Flp pilus assembly protein protease CpaA|nr:prepilin peptidase [Peptococcaceae bacterium]